MVEYVLVMLIAVCGAFFKCEKVTNRMHLAIFIQWTFYILMFNYLHLKSEFMSFNIYGETD